jgi:hypothetical protein
LVWHISTISNGKLSVKVKVNKSMIRRVVLTAAFRRQRPSSSSSSIAVRYLSSDSETVVDSTTKSMKSESSSPTDASKQEGANAGGGGRRRRGTPDSPIVMNLKNLNDADQCISNYTETVRYHKAIRCLLEDKIRHEFPQLKGLMI